MKFILFTFAFMIGLLSFMFVVGFGLVARVMSAFVNRKTPSDMALLNNLATLTPMERSVIADSLARNDQTIGVLGDLDTLKTLAAKQIVVEEEEASGIISYRITDPAWTYLQSNKVKFSGL